MTAAALAERKGRRLVPRPGGVRPARPRGAQHSRRSRGRRDAGDDEPEDQVPRELSPFAPVRAARARPRVVRDAARRGLAVHAAGRARARAAPGTAQRRTTRQTLRTDPDLLRRVNMVRSTIPAITHVDYSARVQTVDERHGRFYRLLQAFHQKTGCPVLVNTSFNLSWEPIVLTPEEAYHTFMQSEMDVLVLEDCRAPEDGAAAGLATAGQRQRRARRSGRQPVGRSRDRRSARRVIVGARAIPRPAPRTRSRKAFRGCSCRPNPAELNGARRHRHRQGVLREDAVSQLRRRRQSAGAAREGAGRDLRPPAERADSVRRPRCSRSDAAPAS